MHDDERRTLQGDEHKVIVDLLEMETLLVEVNTKHIVLSTMIREDLHDENRDNFPS